MNQSAWDSVSEWDASVYISSEPNRLKGRIACIVFRIPPFINSWQFSRHTRIRQRRSSFVVAVVVVIVFCRVACLLLLLIFFDRLCISLYHCRLKHVQHLHFSSFSLLSFCLFYILFLSVSIRSKKKKKNLHNICVLFFFSSPHLPFSTQKSLHVSEYQTNVCNVKSIAKLCRIVSLVLIPHSHFSFVTWKVFYLYITLHSYSYYHHSPYTKEYELDITQGSSMDDLKVVCYRLA